MTPKTVEELDEMRARLLVDTFCVSEWEEIGDEFQTRYLEVARAIREADAAHGVVSAPTEATEEMIAAVEKIEPDIIWKFIWEDMLDTSPFIAKA